MKDEREAKLPRWARDLLTQERTRADRAERKLAAHLDTVEPSHIWYGDYNNPIYIPPDYGYQTVHFQLGEIGDMHTDVNCRIKDGAVEVGGGHGLSLDMEVSNRFRIRFSDRR
ncbi:hypothetical protein KIV63_gp19 [Mycobacterium phage SWU2]|uniref:Uncharacterized protein n=1 Tax=Mycobacterium phage SWU2 TaxID=2077150 RepID=A0A2K9VIF5_9CAUD|nr:hypothetical protein KIV63_gp19 [Mycobacterium phage SWU2]AUV62025.1 hypothetical protein JX_gp66 [Mycobacterium phage SWU2]